MIQLDLDVFFFFLTYIPYWLCSNIQVSKTKHYLWSFERTAPLATLPQKLIFLFYIWYCFIICKLHRKYQPECFKVLNISHGGIKATCPGNIYIVSFSKASPNLPREKPHHSGQKRARGRKQEERKTNTCELLK